MEYTNTELAVVLATRGVGIKLNEPMSAHTSLRIGGPAACFAEPDTAEQIAQIVSICRKTDTPLSVIGNGTNLLVADDGVEGVVMHIGSNFSSFEIKGDTVIAQSGALLTGVCRAAAENGLSGLEFASGIPGTMGGAVFMNAGAYGGEIKDVIESVTAMNKMGEVKVYSCEECGFEYRSSIFQSGEYVILEVRMKLTPGEVADIETEMKENQIARIEKQPLHLPNAGSAFKRPADGSAAAMMIDKCGFKGVAVGGAQVSEKHAGFIVNRGNATASDVDELMSKITERVREEFGVTLECEYCRIGGKKNG